ncbi:MAG: hypothetical protein LBJ41_03020, partial [Treponema sp.]|nr:hypothetical protein [Treponema sp.]
IYDSYKEFEEVTDMIAGTLLSVSERAEKRVTAQRDKFWAPKLEAERAERVRAEEEWKQADIKRVRAEEEWKQADIKRVRKLYAEGWQDTKIAETLDMDVATVRLYASL